MQLPIALTVAELRPILDGLTANGETVALVPTMGALHEGHMALIEAAKQHAQRVVVSIFVNPLQFGMNEDYSQYPRPVEEDVRKLTEAGVDVLYAPPPLDMYPEGYSTLVSVRGLGDMMEGAFRPGHFDGVATVVFKLFLRVQPDFAVFGEKDFQQMAVIAKMVVDLELPVKLIPVATVRDRLAFSSRNAYLTPEQKAVAGNLYDAMLGSARAILDGNPPANVLEAASSWLLGSGFTKIDYFDLRDMETLEPVTSTPQKPARIFAAVWLGNTRLIDNIALSEAAAP